MLSLPVWVCVMTTRGNLWFNSLEYLVNNCLSFIEQQIVAYKPLCKTEFLPIWSLTVFNSVFHLFTLLKTVWDCICGWTVWTEGGRAHIPGGFQCSTLFKRYNFQPFFIRVLMWPGHSCEKVCIPSQTTKKFLCVTCVCASWNLHMVTCKFV